MKRSRFGYTPPGSFPSAICVDQTRRAVNRRRGRGTHRGHAVATNARDLMRVPRYYLEQWEQAQGRSPASPVR